MNPWSSYDVLVSLGFIDAAVRARFDRQHSENPEGFIDSLMQGGVISPLQRDLAVAVMETGGLAEALGLDASDTGEILLGAVAICGGLIDRDAFTATLITYARMKSEGKKPEILDILLEEGRINLSVMREILKTRASLAATGLARCPGCSIPFSAKMCRPGALLRCKKCGLVLSLVDGEAVAACEKAAGAPQRRDTAIKEAETVAASVRDSSGRLEDSQIFITDDPEGFDSALAFEHLPRPDLIDAPGGSATVLGKYDLLGEIGRGGMGAVFHAKNRETSEDVAVKLMLAGETATKQQIMRFTREIKNMSRLVHPGIVRIHDIGVFENRRYYVMDYVRGGSLKTLVSGGPVPARKAAELVMEICDALEYAHGEGIVHRDLKPENILLDAEGRVRIADFGLAKDLGADIRLTREGSSLGTPAYIPPEQAQGKILEIDRRSDVYSLGAVLYELLTAQPPFRGSTRMEILVKVQGSL